MMQQYLGIKASCRDCLLFYQMGEFYELFFEDAKVASSVLDVALTKRGKCDEQDIPMCGVPIHSYEYYLEKLIKAGFKVAICEQLESPEAARKRGYKAVVNREVVRIVTPGTIFEESLLESKQTNYLCSIAHIPEGDFQALSIAWVDVSTGELQVSQTDHLSIQGDLARLRPVEIIIAEKSYRDMEIQRVLSDHNRSISTRADNVFELERCGDQIKKFFKVASLEGLCARFTNTDIVAVGSLIEYLQYTQKAILPKLNRPNKLQKKHYMHIDSYTRKNLELDKDISGGKTHSLFNAIDKTLTSVGGRLLRIYLCAPLCDSAAINQRLDNVSCFYSQDLLRSKIRSALNFFPDIERALSRLYAQKGTPKDLGIIRDGLSSAMAVAEILAFSNATLTVEMQKNIEVLGNFQNLFSELRIALKDELPMHLKDGGFIREGFNPQLDQLRDVKNNANNKIIELRDKYRLSTGIPNLKIAYNNVIGYYVEATPSNARKIQESNFIHKQTLGNSVRFTTDELKILEDAIISCDEKLRNLELELFKELVELVIDHSEHVTLISQAMAKIDVFSALAELAVEMQYVRPIVDDSNAFEIIAGRHPVIEQIIRDKFIPNSCDIREENKIWLITGPNMAGKSTFLRQNALICLLSQIGSFVPATKAHIGIVDKLFTRVGAGDDIARGHSTFFTEMIETSSILNSATSRSLIILDELGRGTSTHDGLAIAWAVIEYIHDIIQSKTLFSTHYHELTDLDVTLKNLKCYTIKVAEWDNKIVFMHEVISGKADSSYGIHVAELAGIPAPILDRASAISAQLKEKERRDI
ncbi:DNA mismatch repair protein MutS [Rickettsiales endosymbiont of Peranema trichophorum]|nr:DNA mismatch repair protein MutS [Rickettsiales endosymbiont of Peranema trichophorum]